MLIFFYAGTRSFVQGSTCQCTCGGNVPGSSGGSFPGSSGGSAQGHKSVNSPNPPGGGVSAVATTVIGAVELRQNLHVTVRFYEHEFFQGNHVTFYLLEPKCYNLPDKWDNEASSGTADKCIILWEGKDCKRGTEHEHQLEPNDRATSKQFVTAYLNDAVSSIQRC